MEFRKFVEIMEADSIKPLGMVIPPGVFGALPTQVTGSETGDLPFSSGGFMGTNWLNGKFDLKLPAVTKTSQIRKIDEKKNPIFIFLADGTKIYIPYDAYKKINVPPEVGRTLMVTFQRRTDDTSNIPTKIDNIRCY